MSDNERMMEASGHMLALRTVLGAAITNVDAALAALGAQSPKAIELTEPGVCTHPPSKIKDYTSAGMTERRWMCECGEKGGAW